MVALHPLVGEDLGDCLSFISLWCVVVEVGRCGSQSDGAFGVEDGVVEMVRHSVGVGGGVLYALLDRVQQRSVFGLLLATVDEHRSAFEHRPEVFDGELDDRLQQRVAGARSAACA